MTSAFETTALAAICLPSPRTRPAARPSSTAIRSDGGLEPHLAAAFLDRLDQDVG
ncbi:MAG: hypothetical protein JO284_10220 [Planctomycetaceae bacterium]|nr:hypothetical protein [Planctomycetaceae bacterium]MBV8267491.1 hypothetical protein [Planctomycetaceae bacterium]MBV8314549.1 hypothetical protein [Planctomycetaceae bacterium]MBV8384970.1 hypothetical protein [Planctomycetaceae bacterium]MBV8611257.1 hypothetical protein [Singulisphaera sp.]